MTLEGWKQVRASQQPTPNNTLLLYKILSTYNIYHHLFDSLNPTFRMPHDMSKLKTITLGCCYGSFISLADFCISSFKYICRIISITGKTTIMISRVYPGQVRISQLYPDFVEFRPDAGDVVSSSNRYSDNSDISHLSFLSYIYYMSLCSLHVV